MPFDPSGEVKTIVGEGLFEFGDKNGKGAAVRLQHALGVAYLDGKLYVADTYNSKIKVITYKVKKGETLLSIAKRYGQKTTDLMELNNLKTRKLQPGQELTVVSNGVKKTR